MHFTFTSGEDRADNMTTGICDVDMSAVTLLHNSIPLIPSNAMSDNTISTSPPAIIDIARSADGTETALKSCPSLRTRYEDNSALSSTINSVDKEESASSS